MFPTVVLAWEAFQKVTLIHPGGHQRQARLKVKSWTSSRDAIKSTPVHPHPISVVELGGMRTAPESVRDRLSLTRKEKLLV